jgi:hypothetical protein
LVRPTYEFEGAGVVVERSLLAKSKAGKQLKLTFDDDLTSTHEYPSERLLLNLLVNDESHHCSLSSPPSASYSTSSAVAVVDSHYDDDDDVDNDVDSNYDSSSGLSSYKSRSVVNNYVIGQTRSRDTDPDVSAPPDGDRSPNNDNVVLLRPVDSESVSWSTEATNDLLF